MKLSIFFYFLIFYGLNTSAQVQMVLSKGDSLRNAGKLDLAIEAFREEYTRDPLNEINLYNYSCALSISRQMDSAFKYLIISTALSPSALALTDPDFLNLRDDKRWDAFENKLIEILQKRYQQPFKDIEYAKELWKMKATDQAYYSEIEIAEEQLGRNSTVVYALWELKNTLNSKNQEILEALIKRKGWPKNSQVGNSAAGAAFLVIQHADLAKQKMYLPVIKKMCEENEADWSSYALMYDRVQISEKKPQRYGSQVTFNERQHQYELYPLEDEARVDEWRKQAGLGPLSEYVARWKITFNPKK